MPLVSSLAWPLTFFLVNKMENLFYNVKTLTFTFFLRTVFFLSVAVLLECNCIFMAEYEEWNTTMFSRLFAPLTRGKMASNVPSVRVGSLHSPQYAVARGAPRRSRGVGFQQLPFSPFKIHCEGSPKANVRISPLRFKMIYRGTVNTIFSPLKIILYWSLI